MKDDQDPQELQKKLQTQQREMKQIMMETEATREELQRLEFMRIKKV